MVRAPRADEAGGIYHAMNRGNARQPIFFKAQDYPGADFTTGLAVTQRTNWQHGRCTGCRAGRTA